MMENLERIMTAKLDGFQQHIADSQRVLSEVQLAKFETMTKDSYKFIKKGNEEQHKVNTKVRQAMKEAEAALKEKDGKEAMDMISKSIDILDHRQKLIKIADSSEFGWRTVSEYEKKELADNSEDEKRMVKAENRAQKKFKQQMMQRRTRAQPRRTHPYAQAPEPEVKGNNVDGVRNKSGNGSARRPGICFSCGKPGHWRFECREILRNVDDRNAKA
ncbi:uncharacterized protein LOC110450839 [Mizuhopecten yessoensis]|uniref:uncharacterized protein LOC110450839 n=1 Tax=Mizuhopecten yessoensis TaxID=6573 RepID=UPI000B45B53E|nr:uncharacterized protein LOC110450839 [Mizuhopecten yessoensis]